MNRPIALQTLALLASLSVPGCVIYSSSSDGGNGPPAGGTCNDVKPATGSAAGVLPAEPEGAPAPASGTTLLAMSKVYYGDTDTSGLTSNDAWQRFGLNIDGKVTSTCATDVCTLVGGAAKDTQLDGDNGIDNSFGSNVLPIIEAFDSSLFSVGANQALAAGDATMLLQLDGTGADSSYTPLPGALYHAAPTTSTPHWDGTDVRDVDTASLVGGSISQPVAVVSGGYMNQRTWVGVPATGTAYLDMHLTIDGYPMPPVPIQHVQIVMQVAADGSSATQGTLAGIVRASDAGAWARRWMYAAGSTSLCFATAAQAVVQQIEQASDIMADGSNGPGQQCDGISVGLGFEATAVKLGQARTLPATPVPPPPVCDGGTAPPFDGG